MAEGKAKVVSSVGLNVRKGAGTSYAKIGCLSNGTSVSYYAESNGWLQIKYGGQTGYICKDYTSITSALTQDSSSNTNTNNSTTSGQTSSAGSAAGSVRITASALNVRSGVGVGNPIIGQLTKGQVVKYYGESGGWYKIDYDGKTGWISGDYATKVSNDSKPAEQQQPASSEQSENKKMYVNCDSLNVRTGPGTGNSKIGSVSRNQELTVTGSQSGWYKIKYGSGTGWVCGDYLTSKKPATSSGGSVSVGTSGWARPMSGGTVTSKFGPRGSLQLTNGNTSGSYHYGVDISKGGGAAIYAAKGGTVSTGWDAGGYGNWIQMNHGDGTYSRYAHMSGFKVSNGAQVSAGTQIGVEGATGGVTGPHLHFEIRIGGTAKENAVDPLKYIP